MSEPIRIRVMNFTAAGVKEQRTGLLGWVSFSINEALTLEGVGLRRTCEGRFALSFPLRSDSAGNKHDLIRPSNSDARREIETQVFDALHPDADLAP